MCDQTVLVVSASENGETIWTKILAFRLQGFDCVIKKQTYYDGIIIRSRLLHDMMRLGLWTLWTHARWRFGKYGVEDDCWEPLSRRAVIPGDHRGQNCVKQPNNTYQFVTQAYGVDLLMYGPLSTMLAHAPLMNSARPGKLIPSWICCGMETTRNNCSLRASMPFSR